jgi:hypothetical protein
LCQRRMIAKMIVEKQMEWRLAGETEVLGENLPQRHFCPSQNPTWPDPGLNQGRRGGKPATNRLRWFHIKSGLLSPRHGASSGWGWRRRPPGVEGSCEYIE